MKKTLIRQQMLNSFKRLKLFNKIKCKMFFLSYKLCYVFKLYIGSYRILCKCCPMCNSDARYLYKCKICIESRTKDEYGFIDSCLLPSSVELKSWKNQYFETISSKLYIKKHLRVNKILRVQLEK